MRAAFRNVDYQVREVQQDLDIRTAELASVEDINADLERYILINQFLLYCHNLFIYLNFIYSCSFFFRQIADLKSAAEKAKSGSIKRRRRSHKD